MKIIVSLIFLFSLYSNAEKIKNEIVNLQNSSSKNIWIKTFQNYKNYNIVISNISKTEFKIKNSQNNSLQLEKLQNRLAIYKSKIGLYDKNNNFDEILRKFKYTIPTITLRDFIFKTSSSQLNKEIFKYTTLKNDFYLAIATLQNSYEMSKNNPDYIQKIKVIKDDLDYFNEYSENIEKTYQNLLETKDELNKKYQEYKDDVFLKHIMTLVIIIISYIVYKIIASIIFYFTQNKENHEEQKNYRKLLSILFVFFVLFFVIVRYIDDLIYIITFLSVVAAALTIAMKEILLNIAGAIYIFFSSMVKVGDRVMVQFETKHTIGDITDISLVKIKLNEVEDYANLKEVKSVGRTIYIPNSYIFTKVFYNYSLKKNGIINDLIEFEFDSHNDFQLVEEITKNCFEKLNIQYSISFTLNSLKTAIIGNISYQTNYKEASKNRGKISINLLEAYRNNEHIKLKASKAVASKVPEEE
jgi:small-conductance mechanosensitive channel